MIWRSPFLARAVAVFFPEKRLQPLCSRAAQQRQRLMSSADGSSSALCSSGDSSFHPVISSSCVQFQDKTCCSLMKSEGKGPPKTELVATCPRRPELQFGWMVQEKVPRHDLMTGRCTLCAAANLRTFSVSKEMRGTATTLAHDATFLWHLIRRLIRSSSNRIVLAMCLCVVLGCP